MTEQEVFVCLSNRLAGPEDLREAVSIHTRKVTDSCRDKDCIEDLRVYLTRESQALLDASAGLRPAARSWYTLTSTWSLWHSTATTTASTSHSTTGFWPTPS